MSAASKYYITWLCSPASPGSWLPDLAQTLNNLIKESHLPTIYTFIEVANIFCVCVCEIGKNPEENMYWRV